MAYNTVQEIRRRSAILQNYNITTASIAAKNTSSTSIVNGFIVDVYVLPISGGPPALLKEIAGQLAEAMILKEQFGPEVEDQDKDGYRKWEAAIDTLKMIQSKRLKIVSDTTSLEIATTDSYKPSSLPNATSDGLTTTASTAPNFRMGDCF